MKHYKNKFKINFLNLFFLIINPKKSLEKRFYQFIFLTFFAATPYFEKRDYNSMVFYEKQFYLFFKKEVLFECF